MSEELFSQLFAAYCRLSCVAVSLLHLQGWMDGWKNGWTDGWKNGWTDGFCCWGE